MATKKRITKGKAGSFMGLPAKKRAAFAKVLREAKELDGEQLLRAAGMKRESLETWRQRVLNDSQKTLRNGIDKLANVRDALSAIERDDDSSGYFDARDLAGMARAFLAETGAEIEQALCNLGIVKSADYPAFVNGKLKSEMPKESGVHHG